MQELHLDSGSGYQMCFKMLKELICNTPGVLLQIGGFSFSPAARPRPALPSFPAVRLWKWCLPGAGRVDTTMRRQSYVNF